MILIGLEVESVAATEYTEGERHVKSPGGALAAASRRFSDPDDPVRLFQLSLLGQDQRVLNLIKG